MKQSRRRAWIVLLSVIIFVLGILLYYGKFAFLGDEWATYPANKHLYSDGLLTKAGRITDRNGEVLAITENGKRHFHERQSVRKATLHAVGDLQGFVSTGMHSAYLSELCGYDPVNGVYNRSGKGNDITLTLDSEVCVTALNALGNRAGTVGIYNYQTGELVCMVSTPTFDPQQTSQPNGKGIYVNRFLSGVYTPGSIFKLVTAMAALENLSNPNDLCFSCKHGITIAGEWLSCLGNHHKIELDQALVYSCNAFFGQTALKLGRKTLTKTAEKVGFNKPLSMDGVSTAQSKYEVKQSNDIDFGWSGVGQHNDLVNPFQYLTFMGGIANGGKSITPYMVKKITTPSGIPLQSARRNTIRMMSTTTADRLTVMMRNNVKRNYGDSRFAGLNVCGKTGTAEVGDQALPHSWFVGFCDNEEYPYAFTVIVENAGAGNGAATRVASTVLKALR